MKTINRQLHWSCDGGFSLIEVMISLLILAISLCGLMSMQLVTIRTSNANLENQMARDIVVSVIDEVKTLTNFELRQVSGSVLPSGGDLVTDLNAVYDLTGIDTSLPANYDYVRWDGLTKYKDPTNLTGPRYFTIKLAIDEMYLLQDILARGLMTVYWSSWGLSSRNVDSMEVEFFIHRQ